MNTRALLLGAVAALALASPASAGGWYVAVEGGINGIDDADVSTTFLGAPGTGTVSADTGWVIMAAVGTGFSKGWRVEGEFAFRDNDASSELAEIQDWSLMANILYDFNLSPEFKLALGAGLGVAQAKFNISALTSDTDTNFALQSMLELSYAVSPSTDLTLGYRYMAVIDPAFQFGNAASIDFDSINNRSLTVGVRWQLSPPEGS